ncbi:hypothetical protein Lepto7376_4542 [[Leptolyngbya] sp. PCC 7376]|nr:hypothetical protein Lepto7376_4542 [[Leptolyngbya] sp. PCC 7376]
MNKCQSLPIKSQVKRQFANDLKNCNLIALKAYLSATIFPLLYKYLNFKHGTKGEMVLSNQTKCLKITIKIFWQLYEAQNNHNYRSESPSRSYPNHCRITRLVNAG